ncbi:hypothetical protein ABUK63_03520 [Lactococcus lactis]|uniref:hypothetical protein n=1 Tax=Lactococcus lactis TaxID=1358 RepID=UPI002025DE90|nr:hypothetical protein [Lactococcus lactis]MCL9638862.1 hypothetical protein [Lactococcus lactis]
MKPEYENMTVEETYYNGLAKKIGVPKFSWTFATPLTYSVDQPINNRGQITIDDLYSSLTDEEKKMTVKEYLSSKKSSNKIFWMLGSLSIFTMGIAAFIIISAIIK